MRKWQKTLVLVLAIVMVIGLSSAALAASVTKKQLTAEYSGIQITLDGQKIEPKDANGTTVEPFIVDGTTYLPVRALSNALGLDVDWDQATQTVKLSTKETVEKSLTLNFSFGKRTGVYSGAMNENSLPHGQGTFTAKNEAGETWVYSGMWENGHLSGFGITTWGDGQTYIGMYEDDVYSDLGAIYANNGSRFFGEFVNGEFSGQGVYTFDDGSSYCGAFLNGDICGLGAYSFADGTSFSGEFTDSLNGEGVYINEIGNKYIATLKDGSVTWYN